MHSVNHGADTFLHSVNHGADTFFGQKNHGAKTFLGKKNHGAGTFLVPGKSRGRYFLVKNYGVDTFLVKNHRTHTIFRAIKGPLPQGGDFCPEKSRDGDFFVPKNRGAGNF